LQSSYTWSKVIDEPQSQLGVDDNVDSAFATDPLNRATDRGVAGFDITQNWHLNATYLMPTPASMHPLWEKIIAGWRASLILGVRSGFPFTPVLQTNRSRSVVNGGAANIDRPNVKPGRKPGDSVLGGPTQYYDTSAFVVPEAGFLGTSARNAVRGPGFSSFDMSLAKHLPIEALGDSGQLEVRVDFFNIFNRANFAMPDRTIFTGRDTAELPLPTAGRIRATAGASRQIQFAIKLMF
jgi:hypothetical protein